MIVSFSIPPARPDSVSDYGRKDSAIRIGHQECTHSKFKLWMGYGYLKIRGPFKIKFDLEML